MTRANAFEEAVCGLSGDEVVRKFISSWSGAVADVLRVWEGDGVHITYLDGLADIPTELSD